MTSLVRYAIMTEGRALRNQIKRVYQFEKKINRLFTKFRERVSLVVWLAESKSPDPDLDVAAESLCRIMDKIVHTGVLN